MERGGALMYRCEVARSVSGWPVTVYLWATTPPDEVARVAGQLAGLRETRMCASLSASHNVLFAVWLRSVDRVQAFETALRRRFPQLAVTDRAVALWQLKLAGQLLDPDGRRAHRPVLDVGRPRHRERAGRARRPPAHRPAAHRRAVTSEASIVGTARDRTARSRPVYRGEGTPFERPRCESATTATSGGQSVDDAASGVPDDVTAAVERVLSTTAQLWSRAEQGLEPAISPIQLRAVEAIARFGR